MFFKKKIHPTEPTPEIHPTIKRIGDSLRIEHIATKKEYEELYNEMDIDPNFDPSTFFFIPTKNTIDRLPLCKNRIETGDNLLCTWYSNFIKLFINNTHIPLSKKERSYIASKVNGLFKEVKESERNATRSLLDTIVK